MSLSEEEIRDVEASWKEIEDGKAKKFTDVEELIKELKT